VSEQQAAKNGWGNPISEEDQVQLGARLQLWQVETDHGERKGPFDTEPDMWGVLLTGADVFWLAKSGRDSRGFVSDLQLGGRPS
jgi:hypothetical protein